MASASVNGGRRSGTAEGQTRLAAARGAHQQHGMPAGRRDDGGAHALFLTADDVQKRGLDRGVARGFEVVGCRRRPGHAGEAIDRLPKVRHALVDDVIDPSGRIGMLRGADDVADSGVAKRQKTPQRALDGLDASVQGEFAERCRFRQMVGTNGLRRRGQNGERQRQIEGTPLLGQSGRRVTCDDASFGKHIADVPDGRADAVARFANGGIAASRNFEPRQPRQDRHFDFDGHAVESRKRA
jgi:hypothetical protein